MGNRPTRRRITVGASRSSALEACHEGSYPRSVRPDRRAGRDLHRVRLRRRPRANRQRSRRGRYGRERGARVQGRPVRATARRRPALEAAAAGQGLGRRPQGRQVRAARHAAAALRGHGLPIRRRERGLPLPQRLDAREVRRRAAAGARLLLRRRVRGRRRLRAALRRREHGRQGRRGRDRQLPARRLRLLRPPGPDEGVSAARLRRLRADGPGRGGAPASRCGATSRRSAAIPTR